METTLTSEKMSELLAFAKEWTIMKKKADVIDLLYKQEQKDLDELLNGYDNGTLVGQEYIKRSDEIDQLRKRIRRKVLYFIKRHYGRDGIDGSSMYEAYKEIDFVEMWSSFYGLVETVYDISRFPGRYF